MGIFIAAALTFSIQMYNDAPVYTLEPVGIEFGYLPEEILPLIEGVMTEEGGALAGQPNSLGMTFGCYYRKIENPITDKVLWIQEQLSSVIPPDLMESMHNTAPLWVEGSLGTDIRGARSLGLMSQISFTFSPSGGVMGRGRAYGIFRNGYAVLITMYGPSEANPQEFLELVVAQAVLSEQ